MRIHQLLARTVEPGDRALFVGQSPAKFFGSVRHRSASSQPATTLLDRYLSGQMFDVIVLCGVCDGLDDETARVWGRRALDLLAPAGRLVVDIGPMWFDTSWPGCDIGVMQRYLETARVLDPLSIIDCFCGVGFVTSREARHWTCRHFAKVLTAGPMAEASVGYADSQYWRER